MKGDFTRNTFDPAKHFSRVLLQQGRVTLDADMNEQAAILLRYFQKLTRDLIGPYAAPGDGGGFALSADGSGNLTIKAGHYYVNGILVENDQDCLYGALANSKLPVQPDYPATSADDPLLQAIQGKDTTSQFGIYLDVWERHITRIEDDSIREKALGGPDTCTRAKVVWQVKSLKVSNELNQGVLSCDALFLNLAPPSGPQLAARVDPGQPNTDACITPPASKYRGVENQLYRVEIHQGGTVGQGATAPQPTFKWSHDNGSVASAWLGPGPAANDLQVASSRGFTAGNWVELSDDTMDLLGEPGILVRLAKVEGDVLSVDPASLPQNAPNALVIGGYAANPKVRRWDQTATDTQKLQDGAVPIVETPASPTATNPPVWIDLEDGVQVQFSPGAVYRTGDYWLIPARVATGKIEWPPDVDGATPSLPPRGIDHHYAPLGFVQWNGNAIVVNESSCQCTFFPLSSCLGFYAQFNRGRPLNRAAVKDQPIAADPGTAVAQPAAAKPKVAKVKKVLSKTKPTPGPP